MARRSRQPATLRENLGQSNPYWSWDEDLKWVYCIDGCGRAFSRKDLLVFHRGGVHHLNDYERNIPDQRVKIGAELSVRAALEILKTGASQGIKARNNSQLVELSSGEILGICVRAIPKRGSGAENTRLYFEGITILLERLFREEFQGTGAPQPLETKAIGNEKQPRKCTGKSILSWDNVIWHCIAIFPVSSGGLEVNGRVVVCCAATSRHHCKLYFD